MAADQLGGRGNAAAHWRAIHDAGDLQFAPLPPYRPRPPSPWLEALERALRALFEPLGRLIRSMLEPLGRLLGLSWPALRWIVIGLFALAVLAGLVRLLAPLLGWRAPARPGAAAAQWAPDREQARAILADADRLAAEGRFDEAVHLLLRRSVDHIEEARPGWLRPAATAREIAGNRLLPESARAAFAVIAERVETSRYALRHLAEGDWRAARAAYAAFALQSLAGTA